MFCEIFLKFCEILKKNFKISCLKNFDNAVSQPPYVGVERGGRAGSALAHPPPLRILFPIRLPFIPV